MHSNKYCDQEFWLTEDPIESDLRRTQKTIKCREIRIQFGNHSVPTLIGIGESKVSCISKQWYKSNKTTIGQYEGR